MKLNLLEPFKFIGSLPAFSIFLLLVCGAFTLLIGTYFVDFLRQDPSDIAHYRFKNRKTIDSLTLQAERQFIQRLPELVYKEIYRDTAKKYLVSPYLRDSIMDRCREAFLYEAYKFSKLEIVPESGDSTRTEILYHTTSLTLNIRVDTLEVQKVENYYTCSGGQCKGQYLYGINLPLISTATIEINKKLRAEILIAIIALDALLFFTALYFPRLISKKDGPSHSPDRTKVDDYFQVEVDKLWQKCDELYNRSSYLLIGGVIMAFVGIVVFYVAMPERPFSDNTELWLKSARSFGALVFLESIAWFLLRQYRTLMDDFKGFYRMRTKKTNQLIAFKMLESNQTNPALSVVVGDLLQEDLSGKLKKGETTEQLESGKQPDNNPVFDLLNRLIDKTNFAGGDQAGK